MTERKGDWIQVYTGRRFWPLDPRPEEIDILDIAHALSMQCRYGGHTSRFYSVAEHCVKLAETMPTPLKLTALLHDASEAYMVDVPRPLKKSMPEYRAIEDGIMAAVAKRYGFEWPLNDYVASADTRILMDERRVLMGASSQAWSTDAEPLGVTLSFWSPEEAKAWFLREYYAFAAGAA